MTQIWVGAGFFAFVLTAVAVAGYCYQRLAERRHWTSGEGSGNSPPLLAGAPSPLRERPSRICSSPSAKISRPPRTSKIRIRVRLTAAGYRWPSALPIFYGIKCGSALFFAGIARNPGAGLPGRSFAYSASHDLRTGTRIPAARSRADSRVRARAQRLRSAIPPALDLMVLAMEAGQALDQSIADASRGLKRTYPDLSGELAQLCLELENRQHPRRLVPRPGRAQ